MFTPTIAKVTRLLHVLLKVMFHQHRPGHPSDQGAFASILPRADEHHVCPLLKPAG